MLKKLANEDRHGTIVVAVNVSSASVLLDGSDVGEATDGVLRLEVIEPGEHRVEIRAAGYSPHATRLTVIAGAETSLNPSPAQGHGVTVIGKRTSGA